MTTPRYVNGVNEEAGDGPEITGDNVSPIVPVHKPLVGLTSSSSSESYTYAAMATLNTKNTTRINNGSTSVVDHGVPNVMKSSIFPRGTTQNDTNYPTQAMLRSSEDMNMHSPSKPLQSTAQTIKVIGGSTITANEISSTSRLVISTMSAVLMERSPFSHRLTSNSTVQKTAAPLTMTEVHITKGFSYKHLPELLTTTEAVLITSHATTTQLADSVEQDQTSSSVVREKEASLRTAGGSMRTITTTVLPTTFVSSSATPWSAGLTGPSTTFISPTLFTPQSEKASSLLKSSAQQTYLSNQEVITYGTVTVESATGNPSQFIAFSYSFVTNTTLKNGTHTQKSTMDNPPFLVDPVTTVFANVVHSVTSKFTNAPAIQYSHPSESSAERNGCSVSFNESEMEDEKDNDGVSSELELSASNCPTLSILSHNCYNR